PRSPVLRGVRRPQGPLAQAARAVRHHPPAGRVLRRHPGRLAVRHRSRPRFRARHRRHRMGALRRVHRAPHQRLHTDGRGVSVTVYRLEPATVTNRYGGTEKDWTDPTRTPIHDVKAAPWREGEDRGDGREGVVIGWTLFAPDGTSLAAGDR